MTREEILDALRGGPFLLRAFRYKGKAGRCYNVELYYDNDQGQKFSMKVFTVGRFPKLVFETRHTTMEFILTDLKEIEFNIEHNPPERIKHFWDAHFGKI